MRSYSSGLRPSSAYGCSQLGRRLRRLDRVGAHAPAPTSWRSDGGEEGQAVGLVTRRPGERLDRVLGVGHQADHVAGRVADAGDVAARPVRVDVQVAGDDAALGLERVEGALVGDVAALAVLQRDHDLGSRRVVAGPRGGRGLDAQLLVAAHEVQAVVAHERPREQVGLAEHLEAVADAQDWQAFARRRDQDFHHLGEARDRPAAQVVAVGEPARQHDGVDPVQVRVAVPEGDGLRFRQSYGPLGVAVVQRAREGHDPDPGGHAVGAAASEVGAWIT